MNCLGKGNYVYFVSLMASLGTLLCYGAYLAYVLLTETLQTDYTQYLDGSASGVSWSKGKTWSQISYSWAWVFANDVFIGGVGMLALLTAPLAWGLFWYHIYLIWAGMTTNETSKWADWRDDIADGLVFKSQRNPAGSGSKYVESDNEPIVQWPISTQQQLVSTRDGQMPESPVGYVMDGQHPGIRPEARCGQQRWQRVNNLDEVENLYDLGFWDNLKDVIPD